MTAPRQRRRRCHCLLPAGFSVGPRPEHGIDDPHAADAAAKAARRSICGSVDAHGRTMPPAAMFERESIRLREILLARDGVSPLLDLGSSDARAQAAKPHIERELYAPLRAVGIEVVHADLKQEPGVDIAGDILDARFRERLAGRGFGCLLIANVLEHVRDRTAVARACEEIVGENGLILATAPSSFPYHADPLDTWYRPSPQALAGLFPGSDPLIMETVEGETYADQIAARGETVGGELLRTVLWALAFPLRPKSARARLSRWRWYRRPYRVSIALVRVRAISAS